MYTKIDFHKNAVMAVPFDNEFFVHTFDKNMLLAYSKESIKRVIFHQSNNYSGLIIRNS